MKVAFVVVTVALTVHAFGGGETGSKAVCDPPKFNFEEPIPDPKDLPYNAEGFRVEEVDSYIWAIFAGGYNSLLVTGNDGTAMLIDCGHGNHKEILKGVKSILGDKKLTHFFYSHVHHDHVGGAGHVRDVYPDITFVASAATAKHLELLSSPSRPFNPTRDQLVRGDSVVLGGRNFQYTPLASHSSDNAMITVDGNVAFLADMVNPGATAFFEFVFTTNQDVGAFRRDLVMVRDARWKTFVPGHNRIGDRNDIQVMIDFVDAVVAAAGKAATEVDYMKAVQEKGASMTNSYAQYRAYFETVTAACEKNIIAQWKSGTASFTPFNFQGVDVMAYSNCWTGAWYQHMLAPGR